MPGHKKLKIQLNTPQEMPSGYSIVLVDLLGNHYHVGMLASSNFLIGLYSRFIGFCNFNLHYSVSI